VSAAVAGLTGAETGLGEDLWLEGDGVRLHAVAAGRGPVVLLLHGFPDCWYGWRAQLPALAAAGYRAVAVDLRGYNQSDRPREVDAYRMARLVADARAAVASLGVGSAHVVGHDWGGAIAWQLAARHPEAVDRLVICNAPHPDRFSELLRTPAQAARSWYVGAVQVPLVPEFLLGAAGRRVLLGMLAAMHLRPDAFTDVDARRYRAAFRGPWGVRGPLAYYRASARHPRESLRTERRVERPTLVLWGQEDPALLPDNADGLERWVPDLRVERFPGAGHWVMADAAEAVNRSLLGFLAGT
jgi:pimeloyl-ACP methyl ester carboxylesterase